MSDLVSVVVQRGDESVRVALNGEVDVSNAEEVRADLEDAITAPELVVDLTGLDYVDSAGIRALFAVAETAAARKSRCRIVLRKDSPVERILHVAGVSGAVELGADGSEPTR